MEVALLEVAGLALTCPRGANGRNSLLLRAILVSAVAAGCGPAGHPADGVVTPRVSTHRIEVSPGVLIELAYDLEIRPGAPRFAEKYRVLVGFLDADGGVLWRDDHAPSVPSAAWLSGRTVSYTRSVIVPEETPEGPVTVAMALEAPDGVRVVVAAEDLGSRQYRVASFEVSLAADTPWAADYGRGFYPREENGTSTWRWTSGEATLAYFNPRGAFVLYLSLAGQPGECEFS